MNQHARRPLEDLLDRQIEAARLLSTTLAAERSALTGDSPEAVRQQAAEKVRLLETLERLESECSDLGAAAEPSAPADAGITPRRRALVELMAHCRTANEVNGYIIRVRQNQIRQLINIVRGAPTGIYGPHGKTCATALHSLAQA